MSDFVDHTNSPAAPEIETGTTDGTLRGEPVFSKHSSMNPVHSEHSSMNNQNDTSSSYNISSRIDDFSTPQGARIDITNTADGVADTNTTTVALDRSKRRAHLEAKRATLIAQIQLDDERKIQREIDNAQLLQDQEEERLLEQEIRNLESKLHETPNNNYVDLAQLETVSSTQSLVTLPTGILPSLTRLPIEVPSQRELAIMNYRDILVLKGQITPQLAEDFYQQSLQADQALKISQTILPDSMLFIKLRVKTSYKLLKMTEEEARDWNPELLTVREIAYIIYQIYGSNPKTVTPVQIEAAINAFNWGFDLDNKDIEEESYKNLHKLITDHYGTITCLDATVEEDICKQIYKKLPNQTEMNRSYKLKKEKECPKGTPDTVLRALDRYLSCIQDVRAIIEAARAHASMGPRWFSGSTHEKQNTITSENEVIGYGQAAQRAATHMANLVIPHTRDTDWHERNRKVNNRCETCGKTNHARKDCRLHGNSHANMLQQSDVCHSGDRWLMRSRERPPRLQRQY